MWVFVRGRTVVTVINLFILSRGFLHVAVTVLNKNISVRNSSRDMRDK